MKKSASETYWDEWITESARRTSPLMIKRHIIKHAKELTSLKKDALAGWAASMHNLVRTFEKIHGVEGIIAIRLAKLYKKYNKNRKRYSPPPGGKIPERVKMQSGNGLCK